MGKKQTDYTIDDLKRLNLGFLTRGKSEETIRQQTEAFNYLLDTATQLGADIGKWLLLPDFGMPDVKGTMQTNRDEINKVLFTKLEIDNSEEEPSYITNSPFKDQKEDIIKTLKDNSSFKDDLVKAQKKHKVAVSNVNDYLREVDRQRAKASGARRRILYLEALLRSNAGEEGEYRELCRLTTLPNWKFHSIEDSKIRFFTVAPCFQRHINPEAGINQEFNCGYLMAELDIVGKYVEVSPYIGNYDIEGYYHPHISSGGSVCFGDSANVVDELFTESKYCQVLEVLYQLLNTYSDTGPYIGLSTMIEGSKLGLNPRVDSTRFTAPEDFTSILNPEDYVLDVDYDHISELEKGSLVFTVIDGVYRLCSVKYKDVDNKYTVYLVHPYGEGSVYRISIRNKLEPIDLNLDRHREAYDNIEGLAKFVNSARFPRIGTLITSGSEVGRVLHYAGIPRYDDRERNWTINIQLLGSSSTFSVNVSKSLILDCPENRFLGYTEESIREYNEISKSYVTSDINYDYLSKALKVTEIERPKNCRSCEVELSERLEIDVDGDVKCPSCLSYTPVIEVLKGLEAFDKSIYSIPFKETEEVSSES